MLKLCTMLLKLLIQSACEGSKFLHCF